MTNDANNKQRELSRIDSGSQLKKHHRFHWLKVPSILLIIVGVIGILSARVDYFESVFSFLQLPPLLHSLIITVLAGVLLAISCIRKSTPGQDLDDLQDNWRSI